MPEVQRRNDTNAGRGAADYVTKPFQTAELLTRVKTHLALGRANTSLAGQAVTLRQANEQLQAEIGNRQHVENELRQSLDRAERSRRALLSVVEDQQETEAALRASEERFRRAVVNSPFPIMLHAEGGAIIQASQSWYDITGYTREELATVGDWMACAYGDRVEGMKDRLDHLYELDQKVADRDRRIRTKGGATRIWEFSAAPLGRLPDGRRLIISMAMDVTERRQAEQEIRQLNVDLEQRVRQRTAQLEVSNQELEAFSYSVSHDLRAPLRGIDGWSLALVEDCGGQLDATGHEYLARVRSEAQRMGQLIDDMLQLARVTRAGIRPVPVDITALAQTIVARLHRTWQERQIEFIIQPGLAALGDPALLEVALTNLLDNACKFTSRCALARIEVASVNELHSPTIFLVRDNGVGFDMLSTQKLFGAFQRMHKASEFSGSGIGLATVRRIIARHGGRIWADAKVGQGATFFFTLCCAAEPVDLNP